MEAIRFRVTGRVQGVGFRAFVRELADDLELVGEVWNTRDRAVEGVAQHDSLEALREFQARLLSGPGRPESVDATPTPAQSYAGFSISYTR